MVYQQPSITDIMHQFTFFHLAMRFLSAYPSFRQYSYNSGVCGVHKGYVCWEGERCVRVSKVICLGKERGVCARSMMFSQ